MMYRLSLLVDTDEDGAVRARDLAKECLRVEFGDVHSITVVGWLHREQSRQPLPVRQPVGPAAEHVDGRYYS